MAVEESVVIDQVRQAFVAALDLPPGADVEALELGKSIEWDSVGHMALVAELEERFGIELDTEDIIELTSFTHSLDLLRRLGVQV